MTDQPATVRSDIRSRDEVVRLVDAFYSRVRADDLLGPIFDEVARVDWSEHLPKMYAFWESILFGAGTYRGNPLAAHLALARKTPLTTEAFDRWVSLFQATVDELFEGPVAEEARVRAARIAFTMQHHLAAARQAG